ncbi:ribonuclease P protein component [Mesobacterium sp. TK19101]|uniref:Ribonuclease P protein component n=1 Tax=Mesobacterium hydrothermale TaxID=3111907 RepID=A0ABU6HG38_9RHOB|nr:ribonuclease P protein component [Mesobacterium sp. TK19101]MEC3861418.1 ribonuclease P protein component [Mesobacterium sp. TK19101]
MTPPTAPDQHPGNLPSAVSLCRTDGLTESPPPLNVLRKRSQFLAAARARKQGTGGMLVQARDRRDDSPGIGVGFTCSKKVGNAVARNRAKRRLREVARSVLPELGKPGFDYVLIGKPEATIARPFSELQNDLRYALKKLHGAAP